MGFGKAGKVKVCYEKACKVKACKGTACKHVWAEMSGQGT
jgi:hypothetical protein